MKRMIAAAVLAITFGVASFAFANPVNLREIGVNPGTTVTVISPYWGPSTGIDVPAGEYQIQIDDLNVQWTGTYTGFSAMFKQAPSVYTTGYNITAVANDGGRYERAAWLFNKYGSALGRNPSDSEKTGVQLAIWELIQEPSPSDVGTGEFQVITGSWIATANNYLQEALGADLDNFDPSGFYTAIKPTGGASGYSSYIIYTPVPIPGAVWLLGSGLLGLVAVRRRFGK